MPVKGSSLLTEAQKSTIVEAYRGGGETFRSLGAAYGCSYALIRNVCVAAGISKRLSEEQRKEILDAYHAGEPAHKIAARYGVSKTPVLDIARSAGAIRSPSEALLAYHDKDIYQITSDRWREIYWAPPFPSCPMLAEQLGVSTSAIRRCLRRKGITLRTYQQQLVFEVKYGRRDPPSMKGRKRTDQVRAWNKGKKWPLAMRRKIGEARVRNVAVNCEWCGVEVIRKPRHLRMRAFFGCCASHCMSWKMHAKRLGPDAPRPLIVEKLKALTEERYARINVRSERSTAKTIRLPVTPEQLAKVAPEIGARQPEIDAVLDLAIEEHLAANQGGDTI